MKEETRLPQTNKEGLLYGSIICGITALLMSGWNISLASGVHLDSLKKVVLLFPLFFVIAMLLENVVVRPFSTAMCHKFGESKDSFNAQILFNVLFTVLGMSFLMTGIGDVIGHGFVIESGFASRFFHHWPRNFSVVLGIELLLAQPVARKVMVWIHRKK